MKYVFCFFVLCLLNVPLQAQQADEWGNVVMPLKKVAAYDYSYLWALDTVNYSHGDDVLAFIGNDFQRMRIVFLSVTKDSVNPYQYNVSGKSKVKNNICNFTGTITIDTLLYNKNGDCGEGGDQGELGTLIGSYKLNENAQQQYAGVFEGRFYTYFLWKGKQRYWEGCGDWSCNNMFTGKWTSNNTGKSKKCCWGDGRIPNDFPDIGAGEFSPETDKAPSWKGYQQEIQKYWDKFLILYEKYYPNQHYNYEVDEKETQKRTGTIKKLMMRGEKPWWRN